MRNTGKQEWIDVGRKDKDGKEGKGPLEAMLYRMCYPAGCKCSVWEGDSSLVPSST